MSLTPRRAWAGRDNGLGAGGWAALTSALAGLPLLARLDGVDLAAAQVDLSCKEEGMALAAAVHLPKFAGGLRELRLGCAPRGLGSWGGGGVLRGAQCVGVVGGKVAGLGLV